MIEIRLHGRGGQGSVTAAELLAVAAFDDGREAQAFPAFGVERRGAPVMAFCRISDQPIRVRTQIYEPDYVIVQDATLMDSVDVLSGLKAGGTVLINSEHKPEELKLNTKARVVTFPATKIALEELGRPIMNTAILGAFSGISGAISLEAIERSIRHRFRGELGDRNIKAAQRAYELVKGESK
jgi:pyruvate ferredoxin oxidoreductase gamma subunit